MESINTNISREDRTANAVQVIQRHLPGNYSMAQVMADKSMRVLEEVSPEFAAQTDYLLGLNPAERKEVVDALMGRKTQAQCDEVAKPKDEVGATLTKLKELIIAGGLYQLAGGLRALERAYQMDVPATSRESLAEYDRGYASFCPQPSGTSNLSLGWLKGWAKAKADHAVLEAAAEAQELTTQKTGKGAESTTCIVEQPEAIYPRGRTGQEGLDD